MRSWWRTPLGAAAVGGGLVVACGGSENTGWLDAGPEGGGGSGASAGAAGSTSTGGSAGVGGGAGTGGAAAGGTGGAAAGGTGGGGPCVNSLDCAPGLVCHTSTGRCVECALDADCTGGLLCSGFRCLPACDSDLDCTPHGLLCDRVQGRCYDPTDPGAGGTGGSGTGGTGGSGTGGTGGSGTGGTGGTGTGGTGGTGGALCRADIVWAIDTSCSMADDWPPVEQTFYDFGQQLVSSGVDARVALIAAPPSSPTGIGLCGMPPLGTGSCTTPGSDSIAPTFVHLPAVEIGSTTELSVLLSAYPAYAPMLRAGVPRFLVHVSDDELGPSPTPEEFVAQFTALDPTNHAPGGVRAWTFSALRPATLCLTAVELTPALDRLVALTGGVTGDLCQGPGSGFAMALMQHLVQRCR